MSKVGDYVRFKNGTITKINSFSEKDNPLFNILINSQYYNSSDIKVSSPNIIDLIEAGDYVNGMEVTRIDGTRWDENDLHCYCDHNGDENWKQVMIPANDIKSIVTHEQFERMQYKVGEKQC